MGEKVYFVVGKTCISVGKDLTGAGSIEWRLASMKSPVSEATEQPCTPSRLVAQLILRQLALQGVKTSLGLDGVVGEKTVTVPCAKRRALPLIRLFRNRVLVILVAARGAKITSCPLHATAYSSLRKVPAAAFVPGRPRLLRKPSAPRKAKTRRRMIIGQYTDFR